jgi:hypothetical protein
MPVLVKKPISMLDRHLTVSALGKAAAHASVGKFEDVPSDLVDVATAVGVMTDAGDVAWFHASTAARTKRGHSPIKTVGRPLRRSLSDLTEKRPPAAVPTVVCGERCRGKAARDAAGLVEPGRFRV